jgi:ABC-type amino acid transport substrate-binding protein
MVAVLLGFGSVHASTLDDVRKKGSVTCGVNAGLGGFSMPDGTGIWEGLDVDACRAIAVAIFGDATKVRYVPTTGTNRFAALQSGRRDVASSDSSNLVSIRGAGVPNPDDFVILPDRISKEPPGPMVRRDDGQCLTSCGGP